MTDSKKMENVIYILKILEILGILIAAIGILITIVFTLGVSIIYTVGYVYDCLFSRLSLRFGHFLGKKCPKIKECRHIVALWRVIQSDKVYWKYESPLFTYCFSYSAILILAQMIPGKEYEREIIASIIYIVLYFVGMAKQCGNDPQHYQDVLNNNMEFLKLSFLPLGFIITIVGFLVSITGKTIQDISFDYTMIEKIWKWLDISVNENSIAMILLKMIVLEIFLWIFLYVISLPLQAISFFCITLINYFRKYKKVYWNQVKGFFKFILEMLNNGT